MSGLYELWRAYVVSLSRNIALGNTQKYLQHGDWELLVEFSTSQEVTQILIFTHESLKGINIL